jgi:hypothetical protein
MVLGRDIGCNATNTDVFDSRVFASVMNSQPGRGKAPQCSCREIGAVFNTEVSHIRSAGISPSIGCGHHVENTVIEARTIVDIEAKALPTTQERYQILICVDVLQSKRSFRVERPHGMSHATAGKIYADVASQQVEDVSDGFEVMDVAEFDIPMIKGER